LRVVGRSICLGAEWILSLRYGFSFPFVVSFCTKALLVRGIRYIFYFCFWSKGRRTVRRPGARKKGVDRVVGRRRSVRAWCGTTWPGLAWVDMETWVLRPPPTTTRNEMYRSNQSINQSIINHSARSVHGCYARLVAELNGFLRLGLLISSPISCLVHQGFTTQLLSMQACSVESMVLQQYKPLCIYMWVDDYTNITPVVMVKYKLLIAIGNEREFNVYLHLEIILISISVKI
jgi:hypothetical protein